MCDSQEAVSAAENAEMTGRRRPTTPRPTHTFMGGAPGSRDTAADNAETTDWSATVNHTMHHPYHMGGHRRADPTERGWQDRSSVMGDRSAHSESEWPGLLARTRLRRPPAMEEGDGGQVEFGPRAGGAARG